MSIQTSSRASSRVRPAALVAAPLLALAVACGGVDDSAERGGEIASAPDSASAGSSTSGDGDGDGGSKGERPAAGKSAFFDAQMKYVQCMRTKGGVEDFPDPKLSGYLDWAAIEKIADPNGSGEEYKGGKDGVCGPQMTEAMKLGPERDAHKDYESMLAHATCMRDNGVSKFTNPTMSGGNALPGGDPNPADPQIDKDSPAYKQARAACSSKLLDGLDGMQ
ncbi:hypothetical protein ACIQMR_25220 [Streptomyces sp. NPDC091376]|uniref:hypothetical protein n=1 Tax=Streptomyces sp. NPDC091376 TaxID=3365994 RepID=UPI003817A652